MPELPEVHTISTDLNKHIRNYTIKDVQIMGTYRVQPDSDTFINQLKNQKVTSVSRVAKNIIFNLESGNFLLVHLAMTGQALLRNTQEKMPNWTRVVLQLANNTDTKTLYLTDMRMFGKIAFINPAQFKELGKKYGPEPISDVSEEDFYKQITSKKTTIKNALLDQKIVSGLGNIYATDALFLSGIHPETLTKDITREMSERLLQASKQVLMEGIEHRGSTLGDKMYIDIFGKEGSHQNHFKIYGKNICPNCGNKTENKKIAGRGTYYCPTCQPLK